MRISDWSSDVCSSDLVAAATSNGQSRSFISAIPTSVFFDALATRFDAVKGAALKGRFQFVLPASHEAVAVVVQGGVQIPRYGVTDAPPTATLPIHSRENGRASRREKVRQYG